jgi:type II secretory pathway component PulM
MTDFMAVITDFLAGLQPRERLFIKVGAVALAIALLIMLLLPKWESYSQIKGQRDTLAADFIWLQEKREMVAGLANNCPSVRQKKENFKADLSHLVRRNQLEVNAMTETDNAISLSISGSKSNQFLKLMHQIACRGYLFSKVIVETEVDDLSKIKAMFEVSRVN